MCFCFVLDGFYKCMLTVSIFYNPVFFFIGLYYKVPAGPLKSLTFTCIKFKVISFKLYKKVLIMISRGLKFGYRPELRYSLM